ncbi:MAG: hypothetical protein Unbinned8261contig1001_25 [Prokaryotic dsDNA virus sp.]|nr:MAG: hypothetical protein Unbinned8261contig1001_25 [Prokaryotic dsDNA virus sp.]|tara:strand:- start:243 stop:491 length:249 start_codon:yes stop_codon:yes gene_type:complete
MKEKNLTNKEKYESILIRCANAIDIVKVSEHTIDNEKDEDIKENMYNLSISSLRLLLDNCFEENESEKELYFALKLDEYLNE